MDAEDEARPLPARRVEPSASRPEAGGAAKGRLDWRRVLRNPRVAAGLGALAAAVLLWPFAGFTWIPWLAGLGALILLRVLRLDGPLRGWDLPLSAVAVVIGLMFFSKPWAWALAGSIGVLLAGLVRLPRWRLAVVGTVLCVVSGTGFGFASFQDQVQAEQAQTQATETARAQIAERSEEILPGLLGALDQQVPNQKAICMLLESDAQAGLTAATARPTCDEAVIVLHDRIRSTPKPARAEYPMPQPVVGTTDLVIDACDTRWAAAAGPELGRIQLGLVSATERTYEVRSFAPC